MDKITIDKKMISLGGARNNPKCDHFNTVDNNDFLEIEKYIGANVPEEFKNFYKLYGPISFNKSINVICKEPNPISEKERVNVDYFYSIEKRSKCSIIKLLDDYSSQLPSNLLPFCDGEPGDLICINLNKKNFGKIYYWHHESPEGADIFLIADSFDDFIMRLEVVEDDKSDDEQIKNIKITKMTPEFLEMLRKSGYGPKKDT